MKIERIPIGDCTPDPANARKHDDKNLAAIKGSLVKFGQQTPIVIDSRGIVLKGNGTLLAARALGWETIDVVRTELAGVDAVGYAISDNRTSELAAWDDDALGKTLAALRSDGYALDMIGFDDRDLERWLDAPAPPVIEPEGGDDGEESDEPEPDEQLPPPAEVARRVALGQVWQLGRHRLVCGDSGDARTIGALIGEEHTYVHAHALVSDPPYGLSFMGKAWDYDVPKTPLWKAWVAALRPGAHILIFSGTRTYHRAVVALEDAGAEIRDQMQWIYGTGFPKSHDVSKAIDREAGAEREKVRVDARDTRNCKSIRGGKDVEGGDRPYMQRAREVGYHEIDDDTPVTPEARAWQGWGSALKPANEPICLARKPLEGTIAENVQKHGTGALNIDGGRIGTEQRFNPPTHKGATSAMGSFEMCEGEGSTVTGRWPANVVLSHSPECVQTGTRKVKAITGGKGKIVTETSFGQTSGIPQQPFDYADADGTETVEAWDCAADCAVRMLENQAEGASRFFYVAKPARSERGDGNTHSTVKPIRLMEYLVKLITAPGQTVLEPFAGSGTTLLACERAARTCYAAELDPGHCDIILARWEAMTGKTATLETP